MEDTYENSYTEILEILKYIPVFEYNKIPKEKILFYEQNKNKDYKYTYDVKNPKTLKKTDALIVNLYKDYIASEDEKAKVEEILKLNTIKSEREKSRKYDSNITFNSKKEANVLEENNKIEIAVIEKNEKWYMKIWKKVTFLWRREK